MLEYSIFLKKIFFCLCWVFVAAQAFLYSSVCGISWARILEWVAIPFSRGSSQSTSYSLDV